MKVELLGRGTMGMVHYDCYQRIEGVEVFKQLGKVAPKEFTPDPFVDAVDVCFPSEVHKDYVVAALNAGKSVFCETPLALTLEDADLMIEAAKKNGKILMVGLLMRSIAEYQEVERRVKSGELGKITNASAYRLSNYMTPGSPGSRPHYGDVISELMTFDIDYLNLLFGLPQTVSANGSVDSETGKIGEATATLHYPGVTATTETSAIKPLDFPFSVGIAIEGEKGKLDLKTVFAGEIPSTTLTLYQNGKKEKVIVDSHDPYEYELRYFIDCIESREDSSRLSAEHARDALETVIAIRNGISLRQ